jgi:hypothetical protein
MAPEDGERVLRLERGESALRHGERVVREFDRLGLVVHLEHRIVDDPGEVEFVLLDEVELLGDLDAHRAEDFGGFGFVEVGGEEDDGFAPIRLVNQGEDNFAEQLDSQLSSDWNLVRSQTLIN